MGLNQPGELRGMPRGLKIIPIAYRRINETTAGLDRIESETLLSTGESISCSIFRKRLRRKRAAEAGEDHTFAASDHSRHWNYWLREVEAYRSDLLNDMAQGLRVPELLCVEVSSDEAILYLEDVAGVPACSWDLERFSLAIRQIGRFQGRFVAHAALPTYPWLTEGHLRAWLPDVKSISSDARVSELVKRRESLVAGIERSPRTVCHFDLRAANLLGSSSDEIESDTILIDWSSVGIGALGEDIANMVFDSIWLVDCPPDLLTGLNSCAMPAYVAGLRDSGWDGDEQMVYRNYAFTAGLRFGLLRDGFIAAASGEKFDSTMRDRYQLSGKRMLEIRTAVCDLALDQAMRALSTSH